MPSASLRIITTQARADELAVAPFPGEQIRIVRRTVEARDDGLYDVEYRCELLSPDPVGPHAYEGLPGVCSRRYPDGTVCGRIAESPIHVEAA